MTKTSPRLTLFVKVFVISIFVFWLTSSGVLDFKKLSIFLSDPKVLICNCMLWFLGAVVLNGLRWRHLLQGIDVVISPFKAIKLTMIGLCFSTIMPGAVSGDFVKAYYVYKEQRQIPKTALLITIFLDRLMGLYGIFTISFLAIILNPSLFANKSLIPVLILVISAFIISTFTFILTFFYKGGAQIFQKLSLIKFPGSRILEKVLQAFSLYRGKPWILVRVTLMALPYHFIYITFFIYLAKQLNGTFPLWHEFAAVFPIGMLASAIPIAPNGLGVGHFTFERILSLIHTENGANIFNVIFIGQTSLNLLGIFPYLFLKGKNNSTEVLSEALK